MAWNDGLLPEQQTAAAHGVGHARMLAGPGTGKTLTLTRRVCYLVEVKGVEPQQIYALTFTRAAARELTLRVAQALPDLARSPRIATLHSFALRQLLRNAPMVGALPQPLRVADDWEERHIVLEDLKAMLGLGRVDDARQLLEDLSADWQTLTAEEDGWDERFPNPAFIGAWQEHRARYGYTLRSELVYQLKRALEQYGQFDLEGPPLHLLVDEYQDLNRCDLAIIASIAGRGAQLFVAGDDDQSIYGFRKAHPNGIRRYPEDYPGAQDLPLSVCKRCAPSILDLGLFVARQDHVRIDKPLHAEDGRAAGIVALLRFPDGDAEAAGVAQVCQHLIGARGVPADEILVLLRSDRNGTFSEPIRQALAARGVPVTSRIAGAGPLDGNSGREFLAFLRLLRDPSDHLAWRTLLMVRRGNRVGAGAVAAIHQLCKQAGQPFGAVVSALREDSTLLPARFRTVLAAEVESVWQKRETLLGLCPDDPNRAAEAFSGILVQMLEVVIPDATERVEVLSALQSPSLGTVASVKVLLAVLEASSESIEQEREKGHVNILTMHKAKGLTATAAIVVAAEDEYIPGRAVGEEVGDERRLLYVSLTRAKEYLFIMYCDGRPGAQQHTGSRPNQIQRSLTQFLRHSPLTPIAGDAYCAGLTVGEAV